MSGFLRFTNDPENESLFRRMLGLFSRGETRVRHLGKDYDAHNGLFQIKTYLPVTAMVSKPNAKGACNIVLRVDNLSTNAQEEGERPEHPRIRGQVKNNRGGEPVVYMFHDVGESMGKIQVLRKLVSSGRLSRDDCRDVLNTWEFSKL